MGIYRRLWIALGLAMLFLTATAVETIVVLPAPVRNELVRAVTLTALSQTPESVSATLVHGDGREERFTTPYLLGCDGSKSAARHQLGLTLEGETLDVCWVTADVSFMKPEFGARVVFGASEDDPEKFREAVAKMSE